MKNRTLALALTAILGVSGAVVAEPNVAETGSVNIFSLFDSRPSSATVINMTNLEDDRTVCDNGFRTGDVQLHYIYYGQDADGGICLEFDRFELLSPLDTLTVLASDHNPEGEVGFLVVSATDPETGALIDFNELIGSAYVANSAIDIMWSYLPYAFDADAGRTTGNDVCGRPFIFDAAFTGPIIFDDTDYDSFPETLYVDSFFEEAAGVFENQLTLMASSGQDFINEVDFFFHNNKEDRFSRTFKFVCHTSLPLSDISAVARNLGGDPTEFAVETGWVEIEGRNVLDLAGNIATLPLNNQPALLGVFVQIVRSNFTAGHALHMSDDLSTQIPAL